MGVLVVGLFLVFHSVCFGTAIVNS